MDSNNSVALAIRRATIEEIIQWHEEIYKELIVMAGKNGIAGAHASSHSNSIDYCRALLQKMKNLEDCPLANLLPASLPIPMILFCPNCGYQHIGSA